MKVLQKPDAYLYTVILILCIHFPRFPEQLANLVEKKVIYRVKP